MKQPIVHLKNMGSGIQTVLKTRQGIIEAAVISLVILLMLFMIPVWTTPGNDLWFQISITTPDVLAIMIVLSLANGLLIAMQLYIHRQTKAIQAKQTAAQGATAASAVFGALASTVACAACYSAVLSFLSLGTAAFLVEHRGWIALGALVVTVGAMHFAAKRINNHCASCTVTSNSL